ncbi:MAG: D-alanine--D-alanine ligase [Gemmatimonadales bacterium]
MKIGIACDLRSEQVRDPHLPDDSLEEYDSEETVDAITTALRAAGHDVVYLGGGRRFLELATAGAAGREPIDLVFNNAEGHGSRSREAQVPAVCEVLGLRCTHSDPLTLALSLDKAVAKRVAASHGVATPPFALIESSEEIATAALPPLPAIVKLNHEGSSIGVHRDARCTSRAEVEERARQLLTDYGEPVLVEQFIDGVEVTVAILGTGRDARVVGALEIGPQHAPHDTFVYSIEVKRNYREEVEYHCPPRVPAATLAAIEQCALASYRALGCRDVGRVDLRLDRTGAPWLIEVNPIPGLHPEDGDLPVIWQRIGHAYGDLIAEIVQQAMRRPEPAR